MTARKTAHERRQLVLRSALEPFGERGYYGTSMDEVAVRATVSQPNVQRLFGTKLELFLAALELAFDEIEAATEGAIEAAHLRDAEGVRECLFDAHARLLSHGWSLHVVSHGLLTARSIPGATAVMDTRIAHLQTLLRGSTGSARRSIVSSPS